MNGVLKEDLQLVRRPTAFEHLCFADFSICRIVQVWNQCTKTFETILIRADTCGIRAEKGVYFDISTTFALGILSATGRG